MDRRPMRAWCGTYRYFPDPLGDDTAVVGNGLPVRAWCGSTQGPLV